jgi:two-component system, OmpR family, phosphate regulon sensor histidine kinase PhoR
MIKRPPWWSREALNEFAAAVRSWQGMGTRGRVPDVPPLRGEPSAPAAGGRLPVLQAMLDGMLDQALILDQSRTIVAVNGAIRSSLGAEVGRTMAQVNRSPDLLGAIDRSLATGDGESFQMRLRVPVERVLTGQVTPLRAGPGRMAEPALLVVLRDLTEQERLTRLRADFVAYASHELRTPLASLKGFIETLQGAGKNDPGALAQFLPIMHGDANRMSRLIDDLLSLSRIEMREHVPPGGDADLAAIGAEAVSAAQALAANAGIALSLVNASQSSMAIGDRDELLQVVNNLVQNAIKYGKRGGRAVVTVADAGARIALSVADDGIGIDAQHVPRLTERFYRVSARESRERGGTGLGLAIVKHIVNRHRGELRIESVPGQGSTFTVLLPVASDKRA